MSDPVRDAAAAGELDFLDLERLREWLLEQRWFASKAREISALVPVAGLPLRAGDSPLLVAGLIEVRFHPGTHEVYQVLIGMRPDSDDWRAGVFGQAGGWTLYDALLDPALARVLHDLMAAGAEVSSAGGRADFRSLEGVGDAGEVRPMGAEQSNSSLVFDDRTVLKVYRRLQPGPNPELELLRFLTTHDFDAVAPLRGFYRFEGRLMEATLGVLQEFVTGARDGWELALEEAGGERFLPRCRELGTVTARMHRVLGSDNSDPAFAAEEPSAESLTLLTATVDDEIERIFRDLPDTPAVAPIAGRGEEVRETLRELTRLGATGKVIRVHGDYHLGQTLMTERGWVVLDFEGEPARPLTERRRKRSPLRDVAGMLRSFAYAAAAARQRGVEVAADWEERARAEFLGGYGEAADASLLPPGQEPTRMLIAIFELEKAVYELRYELNNRPDWVDIPVEGIVRLLERAG